MGQLERKGVPHLKMFKFVYFEDIMLAEPNKSAVRFCPVFRP